jgi:hypothetical protein
VRRAGLQPHDVSGPPPPLPLTLQLALEYAKELLAAAAAGAEVAKERAESVDGQEENESVIPLTEESRGPVRHNTPPSLQLLTPLPLKLKKFVDRLDKVIISPLRFGRSPLPGGV